MYISEAISMADKIIVLSKGPAKVKNIYKIELDNKDIPTNNRKDNKFNYYYELISIAIRIILLVFAPAIMIIIGPNATLGNEFKQVKNGSNILYNLFDK